MMKPADQDAIDKFVSDQLQPYVEWYYEQTRKVEGGVRRYNRFYFLGVMLSAVSALVAATPNRFGSFETGQTYKDVVILLIALTSTFLTGVMARWRPDRIYNMRESGRIQIIALKDKATARFKYAMTDDERCQYEQRLIDERTKIEDRYGRLPIESVGRG